MTFVTHETPTQSRVRQRYSHSAPANPPLESSTPGAPNFLQHAHHTYAKTQSTLETAKHIPLVPIAHPSYSSRAQSAPRIPPTAPDKKSAAPADAAEIRESDCRGSTPSRQAPLAGTASSIRLSLPKDISSPHSKFSERSAESTTAVGAPCLASLAWDFWRPSNSANTKSSRLAVFRRPHRIPRPTLLFNPNPANSCEINAADRGHARALLKAPLVGRRQPNDPHQRSSQ